MKTKDLIKKRREELHLTVEQVGDYVGVKKGTVSKWESGNIENLRRDKIAKLSEILKISPLDIIYDDIEPRNINTIEDKKNDRRLLKIIDCYNKSDDIGRDMLVEQAEFIQSKHPKTKANQRVM